MRTRTILAAGLAQVGCAPLATLVENCWVALGGPALLDGGARGADVRAYLDLIEGLDRDPTPLGIERIAQQLSGRYSSPPPAADNRLQVMTIHRAKGLEFDYVIVPGCGRKPQADGRALLAWREHRDAEGRLDLLLAPSPAKGDSPWFDYLRARDKEDVAAEAVRLLYVALTRAKREVHLLGHVTPKGDGPPTAAKGSFFAMLWPAIADAALATLASATPGEALTAERREAPLLRRCALVDLPQPALLTPPLGTDHPLEFDWAGTTAKHIGTVAHRLLQDLSLADQARGWTPALAGFARGQLRALGVARDQLDAAVQEIARAVEATLTSARGRWLFAADQAQVETELCLAVIEHGTTARVIIDRTFVDAEGRRWIVDFKTGSHRGGAREAYLDSELARYRPQLDRYGRIMASLEARPVMLGLYFPLLDGWREWPAPSH